MNPKRLDYSLLLALDALVSERSVTRAARRMHLSQPAMSHALARLRDAFDDPIMVRSTSGMVPTPKALQVHESVREALEQLERSVSVFGSFDVSTDSTAFRVAMVDYVEMVVFPELMCRIRAEAPNVRVVTRSIGSTAQLHGLASGEVDLALAFFAEPDESLHRRRLGTDRYVCITRKGRLRQGQLTLDRYLDGRHLAIAPAGTATRPRLDSALRAMGRERRIVYYAAHFAAAAAIVERTDLIASVHERAALMYMREFDVDLHPLPPEIGLDALVLSQVWHERTHEDKAQRWFRNLVVESCEAIFNPARNKT